MIQEELIAILAIVLIFGTPILITLAIVSTILLNNSFKQRERENARRAYREILKDKVDVLKTAMLIGYSHDEIRELDHRLERLIGEDKLRALMLADSNKLRDLEARELPNELEHELVFVQRMREARNA